MQKKLVLLLVGLLTITFISTLCTAANHSPASYADAVVNASPAVVSIQTKSKIPADAHPFSQDPFYQYHNMPRQETQPVGSGVIIDKLGYILTNNHVIKDASSIIIKLSDGREAKASVVGKDPYTDLAVLKIKVKKPPVIAIGNSSKLRVGDIVLAIGNPFNIGQTVTQGIVSAIGKRAELQLGLLDHFIQTDAAINPGNSGGALIDAYGNLIGINTLIISPTSGANHGVGFAIPIDYAKDIMQQLIATGKIIRGFLGVILQPISKEVLDYTGFSKKKTGAYISGIVHDSPASKAGLQAGDIVVKVDEKAVIDESGFQRQVADLKPGKASTFEIFRRGQYYTFSVVIGERVESKR